MDIPADLPVTDQHIGGLFAAIRAAAAVARDDTKELREDIKDLRERVRKLERRQYGLAILLLLLWGLTSNPDLLKLVLGFL